MKQMDVTQETYLDFYNRFKYCQICRKRFADKDTQEIDLKFLYDKLEIHHIKAKAKGGNGDLGNLKAICGECHYDLHANEFTKLDFFMPRVFRLIRLGLEIKGDFWELRRELLS